MVCCQCVCHTVYTLMLVEATYGVEVNDQDVIQAHIYKTKLINALELGS